FLRLGHLGLGDVGGPAPVRRAEDHEAAVEGIGGHNLGTGALRILLHQALLQAAPASAGCLRGIGSARGSAAARSPWASAGPTRMRTGPSTSARANSAGSSASVPANSRRVTRPAFSTATTGVSGATPAARKRACVSSATV